MEILVIASAALAFLVWGLWVFNPLSGITGSVMVDEDVFAFTKWNVEMKCVIVKANNFTGGGYQQVVAGMLSATLTLEADTYDEGNMAFTAGGTYAFTLGWTDAISLVMTVLIESISTTVDYEGGQPIKIVGQSNGSFTAAIA
jgi:hypothetical protein